jgi:hypothetical protein
MRVVIRPASLAASTVSVCGSIDATHNPSGDKLRRSVSRPLRFGSLERSTRISLRPATVGRRTALILTKRGPCKRWQRATTTTCLLSS